MSKRTQKSRPNGSIGKARKTDVVKTDVVKADLVKTDLVETDLVKTDLVKTDLVKTDLVKTDLVKSNPNSEDAAPTPPATVNAVIAPPAASRTFRGNWWAALVGSVYLVNRVGATEDDIAVLRALGKGCVDKGKSERFAHEPSEGDESAEAITRRFVRALISATPQTLPRIRALAYSRQNFLDGKASRYQTTDEREAIVGYFRERAAIESVLTTEPDVLPAS